MTRRTVVGCLSAAVTSSLLRAKQPPGPHVAHVEWKPRLGVLGPYTPANVEFAKAQGFTNMILDGSPASTLNAATLTDAQVERIKGNLRNAAMHVSALQVTQNHIAPDAEKREKENAYFVKAIELAGKLGVPYIGTASGKDASKPFQQQVDEIVRVYNEKYFKACESNHVRILWEPWPEGPNVATSPVGFEALFKGFGNSPYVGLQYDPSHLVRQFMDPIQTAREFAEKIYDVHLKDTEILWPVLRAGGINPVNKASWWRYRIPGMGSINWRDFFSILQNTGYAGAMSVEQEDPLYGADENPGPDFSSEFKEGFIMAKRYLWQYVPSAGTV
ncbi:MAG TPA: sugar phosphate isomerase/epimerase family protein [Bryobacteraceae bacterium]|jgi:sugar phosphate isomerase/epimerase|nr:sugar phosphate isomerase/epimerase family protein [Bryobacteraceae bacterium]